MDTINSNRMTTVILASLFGATGPLAAWFLSHGVPADQISPLMEAMQTMLAAVTPLIATAFLGWLASVKQRLLSIKSMSPEAANAAVLSLPGTARTTIAIAATPPADLLAAVAKMSDVTQIVVKDTSVGAAGIAAADDSQPKVMTVTDSKST